MQQNHVFLNNKGIIEMHMVDDQTAESVEYVCKLAQQFAEKQRAAHKPVLISADITRLGNLPIDARKVAVSYINQVDFERYAILGNGALHKFASNLILQAARRGEQTEYFDDIDACTAWLLCGELKK